MIILIDPEAVRAALIKGYSSKEDLCDLISVFWDLVFEVRARIFIDRVATDVIGLHEVVRSLGLGGKCFWTVLTRLFRISPPGVDVFRLFANGWGSLFSGSMIIFDEVYQPFLIIIFDRTSPPPCLGLLKRSEG